MKHSPIPVVALGVYRSVAASVDSTIFAQHSPPRYQISAILDLTGSPPQYRYSAHNFAVVLRALQPRPRVFISGLAISEDIAKEAGDVWRTFVAEIGAEGEERDTELIDVRIKPETAGLECCC